MEEDEILDMGVDIYRDRKIIYDNSSRVVELMMLNPAASFNCMQETIRACLRLMIAYEKIMPIIGAEMAKDRALE